MDRLFLDANILFSAAYRADAGLLDLWKLKNVTLCTSPYALEEARINLSEDVQKERLARLATVLEFNDAALQELPHEILLPEKDVPIMLAAIEARASHLITGDLRHFGPYFGIKISRVLIVSPGDYLKSRPQKPKIR
jgi:Predicted nucleic acid-binding protein, contains PIN domain